MEKQTIKAIIKSMLKVMNKLSIEGDQGYRCEYRDEPIYGLCDLLEGLQLDIQCEIKLFLEDCFKDLNYGCYPGSAYWWAPMHGDTRELVEVYRNYRIEFLTSILFDFDYFYNIRTT